MKVDYILKKPNIYKPSYWLAKKWKTSIFLPCYLFFLILGIVLNIYTRFPKFFEYISIFSCIFIILLIAEKKFCRSMNRILALVIPYITFRKAIDIYSKYSSSKIQIIIPLIGIVIFMIGGLLLFKNIEFTFTLLWCLIYFAIVVYFSFLGYIQYILFCVFIIYIAIDKNPIETHINIYELNSLESINWLKKITQISHFYRSVFFTIGLLYIIAFYIFCFTPEFGVTSNATFYFMWLIIFIAVVVVFPIVSYLEYTYIKLITKKIKASHLRKAFVEWQTATNLVPQWLTAPTNALYSIFSISIENSTSYPIKSKLSDVYAVFMAFLNFASSIVTILDIFNKLSNI